MNLLDARDTALTKAADVLSGMKECHPNAFCSTDVVISLPLSSFLCRKHYTLHMSKVALGNSAKALSVLL